MTKTEYTAAIEANLATAETLCADLRQLRNLQKLAKTIPASDTLVAFDVLDKAITDKEATLKATRAELGKARRIVKKFEEIEGMEAEVEDEKPSEDAAAPEPKAKAATKSTGKKKAKAEVAAAADSAEGATDELGQAS